MTHRHKAEIVRRAFGKFADQRTADHVCNMPLSALARIHDAIAAHVIYQPPADAPVVTIQPHTGPSRIKGVIEPFDTDTISAVVLRHPQGSIRDNIIAMGIIAREANR